jgi:hypothetical protein
LNSWWFCSFNPRKRLGNYYILLKHIKGILSSMVSSGVNPPNGLQRSDGLKVLRGNRLAALRNFWNESLTEKNDLSPIPMLRGSAALNLLSFTAQIDAFLQLAAV